MGYGASAGAAAGNAIAPGIGGPIGGLIGSFLDGGIGSSGGPSAPISSSAAVYGSGLDGSGWNVNFAGTQRNSSVQDLGPDTGGGYAIGSGLGFTGGGLNLPKVPPLFLVLIVGAIAWKISRSKK